MIESLPIPEEPYLIKLREKVKEYKDKESHGGMDEWATWFALHNLFMWVGTYWVERALTPKED